MSKEAEKHCWSMQATEALAAERPTAEQRALLDHVGECSPCSVALAGIEISQAGQGLDPVRSAEIRSRLLERAANDRRIESGASNPRLPAGAGWLAAAGLASLLLTHHAFHEPLRYGWVAAAIIAVIAVGIGVYAVSLRRQLNEMRSRLSAIEDRAGEPGRSANRF